jgi:hypothetical protein
MNPVESVQPGRKLNAALWVLQILLAMVFLFAGGAKLAMPLAEMTKQIALPGWFLRFIGVAEVLGAMGLILPGILRVRAELTPLAAEALVVIMIGATAVNWKAGQRGAAVSTVVIGLLLGFVAYNRRRMRPATRLSQDASF